MYNKNNDNNNNGRMIVAYEFFCSLISRAQNKESGEVELVKATTAIVNVGSIPSSRFQHKFHSARRFIRPMTLSREWMESSDLQSANQS
jgi:hypothetical protein